MKFISSTNSTKCLAHIRCVNEALSNATLGARNGVMGPSLMYICKTCGRKQLGGEGLGSGEDWSGLEEVNREQRRTCAILSTKNKKQNFFPWIAAPAMHLPIIPLNDRVNFNSFSSECEQLLCSLLVIWPACGCWKLRSKGL